MIKKELELWLHVYKTLSYELEKYIPGTRFPDKTCEQFVDALAKDIYKQLKKEKN